MTTTENPYLDMLDGELEAAWELAMKANNQPGEPAVPPEEAWDKFFKDDEIIDMDETTKANPEGPIKKIFCKSHFGIQYHDDKKVWIPFRHKELDYARLID